MMFTLLMIGGATAMFALLAVQPVECDKPAATAEHVEIVGGINPPKSPEWHLTIVSTLNAAQDLLDSLEAQGVVEREFVVLGDSSFAVRWK